MSNPKNIIGKGFDKHPENINRKGPRPKLISGVNAELKEHGYTEAKASDITTCYLQLIQLPFPELREIVAKEKDTPGMVTIIGKAILSGKGFEVLEKILDRTLGKAVQPIDLKDGQVKHVIEFVKFSEDAPLEME